MTTPSPMSVYYDYEVRVATDTHGLITVPVERMVLSMDMDRMPFCAATLTLGSPLPEGVWEALDPRDGDDTGITTVVDFRMQQKALISGVETVLGGVPYEFDGLGRQFRADMHRRRVLKDWITGGVTLELGGPEVALEDKRRIAAISIDTAATTVSELIEWSLLDVFGGMAITEDPIVTTTPIPAGDRRKMNPGESHGDLLEGELQAIDCRLYNWWGRFWAAYEREHVPTWIGAPTLIKLATFTEEEGAPADADPIVHDISEVVERTGDWADGVLVKWDNTDNGGTLTWQADTIGLGANTKGLVVNYDRAQPSGNAANGIRNRAAIRGHNIDVTARNRFDVVPGVDLEVHTRLGVITGNVRAVEWTIEPGQAGEMRVRAQSGEPI